MLFTTENENSRDSNKGGLFGKEADKTNVKVLDGMETRDLSAFSSFD
jgi:hypothetical protein